MRPTSAAAAGCCTALLLLGSGGSGGSGVNVSVHAATSTTTASAARQRPPPRPQQHRGGVGVAASAWGGAAAAAATEGWDDRPHHHHQHPQQYRRQQKLLQKQHSYRDEYPQHVEQQQQQQQQQRRGAAGGGRSIPRHSHHRRPDSPPASSAVGPNGDGITSGGGSGSDKYDDDGASSRASARNRQPPPETAAEAAAQLDANNVDVDVGIDGTTARSLQESSEAVAAPIDAASSSSSSELFYSHTSRLRSDLLTGYDKNAYPWHWAWESNHGEEEEAEEEEEESEPPGGAGGLSEGAGAEKEAESSEGAGADGAEDGGLLFRVGLPVEVGINFHRVFSVDIRSATADLVVWFRQSWTDPRLTWDPTDYGNLTSAWFYVGDGVGAGETSEIWTPDLELWNLQVGLADSLSDAYAHVTYDGTVFWSRPGHLKPVCKFSGLDKFPFDALGCTIEIGSWVYSGLYVRPVKMGGTGYSIGGSDTAGQSFAEYRLPSPDEGEGEAVVCEERVYPPYPVAPEEDWPVLLYHVTFRRSWQPYVRGYIVLQVILNAAGFAAFWLPVPCGERMSLTVTSLLAAVASDLVVASSLPAAAEMTWFMTFSLFSLSFAAIALFESVAVICLFYYRGKELVPAWYRWIERRVTGKTQNRNVQRRNAYAKTALRQKNEQEQRKEGTAGGGLDRDGIAVKDSDERPGTNPGTNSAVAQAARPVAAANTKEAKEQRKSDPSHDAVEGDTFHDNGEDSPEAKMDAPPARRGSLSRSTSSYLNRFGLDADDFANQEERDLNVKWRRLSHRVDQYSRVVVPLVYAIGLLVLMKRADY